MLNQKYTRILDTAFAPILDAHLIEEEGFALVYVKQGTETVVRKSQGVAAEVFAGVSQSRNAPAAALPLVLEGVIDTDVNGGAITLPRLPITGEILVKIGGDVMTIGAGAPADDSAVQLVGDVVTPHADHDGSAYIITMLYEPTVTEARQYTGDMPVGGLSSIHQKSSGLITRGDISTNQFDASVDWASVVNPHLGADGKFTSGGTGVLLSNVVVLSAPSSNNAFLTLRLK